MPEIQYPTNPNSDTAFVVQDDGKKNRALMIAPQDISTLELPKNANSCKGYVTVDGKKQRVILTADISGNGGGSSLPDQTGHSGEFLTTDGTDASWAAVESLPSQTGQSGKFLTTDGTDASWSDKPLINTTNQTGITASLGILGTTQGQKSVAIGASSYAGATASTAIGTRATTRANYAIQLGMSNNAGGNQNNDANTFKVANQNGNYEIMSADGTIPADRLTHAINKYSTMPTASADNLGWIVQYTGTTDATYTHGYLYECKAQGTDPETYAWEEVSLGGGSYTAGTGIDITNDVISVTAPTLQNTATGTNSLTILGTASSSSSATNVGGGSSATSTGATAFGRVAHATSPGAVAIGMSAESNSSGSIAIGRNAKANATSAIMIAANSSASALFNNTDANTFKVANANGNFELMNANGNLPADRLASTTGLADGNYRLRLVMASGVPTLEWVAE